MSNILFAVDCRWCHFYLAYEQTCDAEHTLNIISNSLFFRSHTQGLFVCNKLGYIFKQLKIMWFDVIWQPCSNGHVCFCQYILYQRRDWARSEFCAQKYVIATDKLDWSDHRWLVINEGHKIHAVNQDCRCCFLYAHTPSLGLLYTCGLFTQWDRQRGDTTNLRHIETCQSQISKHDYIGIIALPFSTPCHRPRSNKSTM